MTKAISRFSHPLRARVHSHLPSPLLTFSSTQRYHKFPKTTSLTSTPSPKSPISPTIKTPTSASSYYLESLCPKCGSPDPMTSVLPRASDITTANNSNIINNNKPLPPCAGIGPACRLVCTCRNQPASPSTITSRTRKRIATRIQLQPCGRCARGGVGKRASRVLTSARKLWFGAVSKVVASQDTKAKVRRVVTLQGVREWHRRDKAEFERMMEEYREGEEGLLTREERWARWEAEGEGREIWEEGEAEKRVVQIGGLLG